MAEVVTSRLNLGATWHVMAPAAGGLANYWAAVSQFCRPLLEALGPPDRTEKSSEAKKLNTEVIF